MSRVPMTRQPEGFRDITVAVSDREFGQLMHERAFTGPGTLSAAFRIRAGMTAEPYGIKAARRRQIEEFLGEAR